MMLRARLQNKLSAVGLPWRQIIGLRAALRSRAEFISKIGTVEEEADETALWIELLMESKIVPTQKLSALLKESNDLTAIMAASRKTASGK